MAEAAVHGPATKTTRPQVNVIVDRDALLRGHTEGEERCEFSTCFGPVPVPVSVVQEILDDAFLVGLFHDGVDVQAAIRFGRHTAAAVKDALRIRDDFTCSVAGCNRRARLEIDHTEPVAAGGPTRYTNLRHLCWSPPPTEDQARPTTTRPPEPDRPRDREVTRLIGVYDADGTVIGELSYFLRARVGRAHCALCDITHGRVRERDDWRAERDRLPVPFTTFHRDDQPAAIRAAAGGAAPVVLAETTEGTVVLVGPDELEACAGSPAAARRRHPVGAWRRTTSPGRQERPDATPRCRRGRRRRRCGR